MTTERQPGPSDGVNVGQGQGQQFNNSTVEQHNHFYGRGAGGVARWSPREGQAVPGRPTLTLQRPLDHKQPHRVWLAVNKDSSLPLVLKFALSEWDTKCLEKELTTCRALRVALGDREEFQAPTEPKEADGTQYLEYQHVELGNLVEWATSKGGLAAIALPIRLGIVIDLARMVEEVHRANIFHNDLAADNVLVRGMSADRPLLRLIDFGVAKVWHADRLAEVTHGTGGLGHTMDPSNPFSAPGKARCVDPTVRSEADLDAKSDVYSLGVLLLQLVTGDFNASLAPGWEDRVPTGGIKELIRAATHHDRSKRLESAEELAKRLSRLDERETELRLKNEVLTRLVERVLGSPKAPEDLNELTRLTEEYADKNEKARGRARRNVRIAIAAISALVMIGVGLAYFLGRESHLRQEAERLAIKESQARSESDRNAYSAAILGAVAAMPAGETRKSKDLLARAPEHLRNWEWRYLNAMSDNSLFSLQGHSAQIRSASFSQDGQRILTTSFDKTARVWDANNGRELCVLRERTSGVLFATFTPDGSKIVTVSHDHTARIWDARSGKQLLVLQSQAGEAATVSFTPDGSRALTISMDDAVRVWDTSTGGEVAVLRGHDVPISLAAFSPNGTRIVTGSYDGIVRIWDTSSGEKLHVFRDSNYIVRIAAFSPDGDKIVTASLGQYAIVRDADTGKKLFECKGTGRSTWSASFSHDGRHIATTALDHTVSIWSTIDGSHVVTHTYHSNILSAVFDPKDEGILTTSADNTARYWRSYRHGHPTTLRGHDSKITTACFNPSGTMILAGADDGTVRIWDADTANHIQTKDNSYVLTTRFAAGKDRLAVRSSDGLTIFDAASQREIAKLDTGEPINYAAFNADGTRIATASMHKSTRVWDIDTKTELLNVRIASDLPPSISPDGKLIVVLIDNRARVIDVDSGQIITEFDQHSDLVHSATFSPDGSCIATTSNDRTARLWNARNGKEIIPPLRHERTVFCAAFSADGCKIATGSWDYAAHVWDVSSGAELTTFTQHRGLVTAVCFSPDGSRVVSASEDNTVRLWDSANGEEVATLPIDDDPLISQASDSTKLAFSANGDRLILVSFRKIYICDVMPWRDRFKELQARGLRK